MKARYEPRGLARAGPGRQPYATASAPSSTTAAGQISRSAIKMAAARKPAPTPIALRESRRAAVRTPLTTAQVRRPVSASPSTSEKSFARTPTNPIQEDIAIAKTINVQDIGRVPDTAPPASNVSRPAINTVAPAADDQRL